MNVPFRTPFANLPQLFPNFRPPQAPLVPMKPQAPMLQPMAAMALSPPVTWTSNLYARDVAARTGQIDASDGWSALGTTLAVAGTGLGAYHGYKRTGSIGWAIAWAFLGGLFPIITIPVAIAQGFARPEPSFRSRR